MLTFSWQVISHQIEIVQPCDTRLIVNNSTILWYFVWVISSMFFQESKLYIETVWGLLLVVFLSIFMHNYNNNRFLLVFLQKMMMCIVLYYYNFQSSWSLSLWWITLSIRIRIHLNFHMLFPPLVYYNIRNQI